MKMKQARNDERDSKRAFRWAAIIAALLILGAIAFNVVWYKKPPANIDNLPAAGSTQPRPAPDKPPGS